MQVTSEPSGLVSSVTFTVPAIASITLTPISGAVGTAVSVSGTNFLTSDTSCTLSTAPGTLLQAPTCTILLGTVTGSFTVAGGSPSGTYVVTVTGMPGGDFGQATFTVTPPPPAPTLSFSPPSGLPGTLVHVSGTNYAGTTCSLSSNPSGLFTVLLSCSISNGVLTGEFEVASGAAAGDYVVTVTTNISSDTNKALFTITSVTFTLSPASSVAGAAVAASGQNYEGTTCQLSSAPVGLFSSTPACSISNHALSGGFTVASAAPLGGYTVTVTTNVAGEKAIVSFIVGSVGPPLFALSPSSGPAGTFVSISGQNYAGTACTILSASPSGLFVSYSCSISSGTLSGGFTVASTAPLGAYTVTIKTNAGETETAPFTLTGLLTFVLTPTSGLIGTPVSASGSNFVGSTCTLDVTPVGLFTSQTCSIETSTGKLTGGFTVASSASPGMPYTVTVTTNAGETKAAPFTVPYPASQTFALSQTSGGGSTGVTISGTNYVGTTCSLTSTPSGLFTSSSCSISAGQLSGGFTIATTASPGGYTVTVSTNKNEQLSAPFTVTSTTPPCIIATVTFGSEAAPAVQFLRNFRDHLALSTRAGSAFMTVFNAWYYSFSPTVAGYIAANDPLRAPIRVILYPLLGVLGVSTFTYSLFGSAPEFAIVMAGLVASSLIGLVYLTPFMLVGMRALTRRRKVNVGRVAKRSLLLLAGALALLLAGELAGSFLLLAVASSAIVLTCMIAVPTIVALMITHPEPQ